MLRQDVKRLIWIVMFALASNAKATALDREGHTFAFAELLYWQMREGSSENWSQDITPKGATQSTTLYDAPFDFNPGFRIGVGYEAPSHAWNTVLSYTNYQNKAENHASGDIYSAYLGNYFANNTNGANFGPFYDSANLDWDFSFQTIDIELGRRFIIDKILTVRPFVGLKTAFIDQVIDSHWYGPKTTDIFGTIIPITTFSQAREKITQNFWGVGPSLGLDTTWPVYQSLHQYFSLIGNLSGAVMWGHWSFSDTYENNTPVTISVNSTDFSGAETMARGILGVEWGSQMSRIDLKVRLSYEAQVWFEQMQYYNYNMGRLSNLMSLQGANLGLYLTF